MILFVLTDVLTKQQCNAGLGGSRNGGYDLKNIIHSDLDVNLLLGCPALDPRFKKLKFLNDKTDREDIFELLETELIDLVEHERNNNRQENINEGDDDSVKNRAVVQKKKTWFRLSRVPDDSDSESED